eukprot:TRINITY_DN48105_c0_g1_i1.p2 TRINITY_DN48105_c0_g1~~TRINITY_DN48105_c0_g1_i1.p2  ORF type:complete len:149 (+),score=47.48 TRINITY_DN48105_c0_g1_i1:97-543(+)
MGCGASSVVQARSANALKPVQGGTAKDVVMGAPATTTSISTSAAHEEINDPAFHAFMVVDGLGQAVESLASSNPVLAAGLASMAAAAAAKMEPVGEEKEKKGMDPKVALGLAETALELAKAGHKCAEGMALMAASAATATARTRGDLD